MEGPRLDSGLILDSTSALLSQQKVMVCTHYLVTLSLTINETLKWLIAAGLNAGVILVVTL